jgi:hypothetical protein
MAERTFLSSRGFTILAVFAAILLSIPLAVIVACFIYAMTLLALIRAPFGFLLGPLVAGRGRPIPEGR